MKIGFVWQGISDPTVLALWQDGLWQAVQHLKERHEVTYLEPWDDLSGQDVLLYWEAPCTINGQNAPHYKNVRSQPCKKALLFAGGPLKSDWVKGFDVVVVESEINAQECREQGIRYDKAFGVNTDIWNPVPTFKEFLGAHHGTCASWKRQHLAAEALGKDLLLVGPYQQTDPRPFDEAKQRGATVIDRKLPAAECAAEVRKAHVMLQTSDYWGGGQRATLEGMALGMPVVCMTDSPKNQEFVTGLGKGAIVTPSPGPIREACERIAAEWTAADMLASYAYVAEHWSGHKYGRDLLRIVESL